jgi:transposase InsO family protein
VVGGVELLCDVFRWGGEAAGYAGGQARHVPCLPWASPRRHAGHKVAHRRQGAVATWVKNCQQCERAKASRQHMAAVQPIAIPARRFTHIHADIMGPLSAATSCADALIAGWVSRYGVPVQLTSDRGTQFIPAIWDSLCQHLGIQHQPTTAFHPQVNGMVERCHRRLKDALRARLAGPDQPLHLPLVLMGLRAAPTEDTGVSPPRSSLAHHWCCWGRS